MSDEFELNLVPNDKYVTAFWRANKRPIGRVEMPRGDLEGFNDQIRISLAEINKYVQEHHGISAEEDPGFQDYRSRVNKLRQHGRDLSNLLLGADDPEHAALVQKVLSAKGANLTVFVDDENVTVPIGFAHDDTPGKFSEPPQESDFNGFWLSKFSNITTWLNTYSSTDIAVQSETLRALYAADKTMWDRAFEGAVVNWPKFIETLKRVCHIDVGCKHSWDEASQAWNEIVSFDNILLFFGHSDGTSITVCEEEKLSASLKTMFKKPKPPASTLLIANTCMSLAGNPRKGTSIVSLSARAGFAGLVGTDAKISNDYALVCCSMIIDDLCHHEQSLGEAFDRMRHEPDLFPLNLFYSCYGDRSFRVKAPSPAPALGAP
jgi:hypothetical protein